MKCLVPVLALALLMPAPAAHAGKKKDAKKAAANAAAAAAAAAAAGAGQPAGLPPLQPAKLPAIKVDPFIRDQEWAVEGSQRAGLHVVTKVKVKKRRIVTVNMNGSEFHAAKGGSLMSDVETDRGWYLSSLTTNISVADPSVKLIGKAVFTQDANGSVTTSTEVSTSLSGDVSADGPGAGVDITETKGESNTRDLRGFSPQASDTGVDGRGYSYAKNIYKMTGVVDRGGSGGLKSYTVQRDLVDFPTDGTETFKKGFTGFFTGEVYTSMKTHGITPRAKSGFPIPSQVTFLVPEGFTGVLKIVIMVNAQLNRVSVSGKTKFDAKVNTYKTKAFNWGDVMYVNFN